MIGAYVPTQLIGPYLPAASTRPASRSPRGIRLCRHGNPVGKRFRGIVRWATPVIKGGQVAGYVTLALDHDHIRQFSDRLMPTEERFTPIADAIKGNYAFIWDYKEPLHLAPRDYMIVGYDPQTGRPATPWMDEELYAEWQASGKPSDEFLAGVPPFRDQNLETQTRPGNWSRPARSSRLPLPQFLAAMRWLECRHRTWRLRLLIVIFFSGLWKLTTAAAIPYYTGQYGKTPQGFGFVTIGANVDDFHKAATETAAKINTLVEQKDASFRRSAANCSITSGDSLSATALGLWGSTLLMVVVVIGISPYGWLAC